MYVFSAASQQNLEGVHPDLRAIMNEAVKTSPIDFGIPHLGGLRTADEQAKLYANGKSKCDGYETKSKHQTGHAVDVYAYLNGKASWDEYHLSIVAGHILGTAKRLRELGVIDSAIRWGGTFGSDVFHGWDKPHFEITSIRHSSQF